MSDDIMLVWVLLAFIIGAITDGIIRHIVDRQYRRGRP